MTGIYIHVPFCAVKCPYCDFCSQKYTAGLAKAYTDAVIRDIESTPPGIDADTVYFGGGTPSILPVKLLGNILERLAGRFHIIDPEITLEANPVTLNPERLRDYRALGINRLSIGVQSAVSSELKTLGRLHSFERAQRAVLDAASAGFENISCDLMTGIPGQTAQTLLYSIEKLTALPIAHLSNYILKVEKRTPFDNEDFVRTMPDDDMTADLYLLMVKALEEKGFSQYEISNFSKKGFESRHNLKYWECEEYLGFGPSAHSYYGGKRCYVPSDVGAFVKQHLKPVVTDDCPGQDDERIMLGLRLTKGIDLGCFPERRDYMMKKAILFQKAGLMTVRKDNIALTAKGFLVSNSIISEL